MSVEKFIVIDFTLVEIFRSKCGLTTKQVMYCFSLLKDWFQLSKGLKESFNPNYNEPVCPVREYCDSESSDSSSSSVTTDQTDCSIFINEDSSTVSAAGSSSISTGLLSSEEAGQVSFTNEASQSEFGSS